MKRLLAASLLFCAAVCAAQTTPAKTAKAPDAAAIERNNAQMRDLLAAYNKAVKTDAALAPLWIKCPPVPPAAST